jgi:voltage-gated potassium channel
MRLRQILWHQLDPKAYQRDGLSPTNKAVIWIVVLSSFVAVVETEPLIEGMAPWAFAHVEQIFSIIFLTEYLARLWAEGENPRYSGFGGRLRYALSPPAIIDLIAFLPSLVIPGISSPMLLRMFRLMRILRLARLGRFSTALGHLTDAVTQRRDELLLSLMLAAMILVFSAAAMYVLEGENDPEAFGSIPRALWWSVCTLTTEWRYWSRRYRVQADTANRRRWRLDRNGAVQFQRVDWRWWVRSGGRAYLRQSWSAIQHDL